MVSSVLQLKERMLKKDGSIRKRQGRWYRPSLSTLPHTYTYLYLAPVRDLRVVLIPISFFAWIYQSTVATQITLPETLPSPYRSTHLADLRVRGVVGIGRRDRGFGTHGSSLRGHDTTRTHSRWPCLWQGRQPR